MIHKQILKSQVFKLKTHQKPTYIIIYTKTDTKSQKRNKMKFTTYGERENKSILFIHGLASTADLCFKPLLPYLKDYHVIFCELDGHCAFKKGDMTSPKDSMLAIENYILKEMDKRVHCICGFSMGATLAVDLISRGKISIDKVLLDAAITIEMGWMALPFTLAFIIGTQRIKNKKPIPEFLLDKIMGKGNKSIIEMMYPQISKKTIQNACKYIYHYKIKDNLRNFRGQVLFIRGSEEPLPARGQKLLKAYLPQMKSQVFQGMGHGQFLHEHPREYAENLKKFLQT